MNKAQEPNATASTSMAIDTPSMPRAKSTSRSRQCHHVNHHNLTRPLGRILLLSSIAAMAFATTTSWHGISVILAESLSIPSLAMTSRGGGGIYGGGIGNLNNSCRSTIKSELFLQISRGGGDHHDRGAARRSNNNKRGRVSILMANNDKDAFTTQNSNDDDDKNNNNNNGDVMNSLNNNKNEISLQDVSDSTTTKTTNNNNNNDDQHDYISIWPQFDELDKRMIKIALPCIANFAINPLIGAVDLFWVNRMGNALAVAGQAAANQVFSSAFWVVSFLPSVTATLVSKANAQGDQEDLQDAVSQAIVVGVLVSLVGTGLMLRYPEKILSAVLKDGSPALEYAKPYLFIRAFAFLPSLMSLIGFSAFRGTLDTSTPLKISATSNVFNAVLDPILMFTMSMGVPGAALATLGSEIISAVSFVWLMLRRQMFRWSKIFRLPSWTKLKPLLKGGAALQLRNVALNVTFLAVARVTQSLDNSGVAASAHALAIQTFQIGGIVLLALSTVAQTLVPNELMERVDKSTGKRHGGKVAAKNVVNRLMSWGFILGVVLGALQLLLLPILQKSSPLQEVRDAAVMPSILASVYQIMNGLVFIGEGVMVGCGNFMQLSLSTVAATIGALIALKTLPTMYGLTGVWMSFGVFNVMRLAGVWLHQTRFGPLATSNMPKAKAA